MENWADVVTVLNATGKAVLVDYEGVSTWIPNSQIHADSEIWVKSEVGERGTLVIPMWLAEKKGIV